MRIAPFLALVVLAWGCRAGAPHGSRAAHNEHADEAAITALLDAWHAAAARADGAGYLGPMAEDAVYLGTDARERWTLAEFRAFCEPYFARGVGWRYVPEERHLRVEGDVAWFDELLANEKYGTCRGTGVLARRGGAWRLVHYSLSFPIPNEHAGAVVELIRPR
jgi:uncharacterized protein (TIGR02246 family)